MATYPGINPTFDLSQYPAKERIIIHRFAENFYITRKIETIKIGNSQYRAFLMRPATDISLVINVERELVVLFSDYENFEARSLIAFDKISEIFDDSRIDHSIKFIVSSDANIDNGIRHFVSQDPEYPIIIPFRYADFQSINNNFIVRKIRENYVVRDLFGYQSPLRNEYFYFGRDKLLNNVIDLHKSGQNSSLFGLRKSGKTSTIYAISRRAKTFGYRSIIIDCQDPAIHSRRYAQLLSFIVESLRSSLNLKRKNIDFTGEAFQVSDQFKNSMDTLLSEARSDLLIIFDEIESISPRTASSKHWNDDIDTLYFWQILRSYTQAERKYRLTFCFVGTNPSLFESPKIADKDNPVYLFAPKTFITPLSEDDTFRMIDRLGYFMGLDFSHSIKSKIHASYGGHPFFTRQLCSKIHQNSSTNRPLAVSKSSFDFALTANNISLKTYISEILIVLQLSYPVEYEMLSYLADSKESAFYDLVNSYPELVEHLVGYGFLTRTGDTYEIAFDAISDTLKSDKLDVDDLNTAYLHICEGRNKIERYIRHYLFYETNKMSRDEWVALCDKCLNKIWNSDQTITPRSVFSRGSSPIYFIDLLKILNFLGNFSSSGYSETDISSSIHVLNRLRTDAHAKDISASEFSEWRSAISVLEAVFEPPF